ncbi:hypothetical protein TNIN_113211 [Trichonephila inaurata madagascariensis]|uniref:Uncharacterized protein n=1 Tax=Trichonephila inaurata madagascariensis TaxID=2747483 RepID=A0A8X6IJ09_9ARAC|nr:hypothetical protein TNIN_113211 [Trichonephila inaurata madagascariensis]
MGSVWPTANLHDTGRPRSGLTVAQADAVLHRVEKTPKTGQRGRSSSTKNCEPQATATCGSGERQPPRF